MNRIYKADTDFWSLERVIYILAGVMNSFGLALGFFVHKGFFILSLLVSVNLVIFSLTGYCIMAHFLHRFGIQSSCELKNTK
jgi:hypothetical protein